MQETRQRVLDKFLSARFLTTVVVIVTFCWLAVYSLILLKNNLTDKESLAVIEKITMFILGAFVTQVGNIITSYFRREDRYTNLPTEQVDKGGETNA